MDITAIIEIYLEVIAVNLRTVVFFRVEFFAIIGLMYSLGQELRSASGFPLFCFKIQLKMWNKCSSIRWFVFEPTFWGVSQISKSFVWINLLLDKDYSDMYKNPDSAILADLWRITFFVKLSAGGLKMEIFLRFWSSESSTGITVVMLVEFSEDHKRRNISAFNPPALRLTK